MPQPSSKVIATLLCLLLLSVGLTHFPNNILVWDVFGYYLYLPMTFIYHDLGIRDHSVIDTILSNYHNSDTFYQALEMPSGDWVMRYGIGLSILYSPFFFIGHLIANLCGFSADGFSEPYQYSIWAGCMIYTFIGIFMLRKTLLKIFEEKIVTLLLIIIVLGTNYLLHTSVHGQGAMTHNFLFTLYTFILWYTIRWHETHNMKHVVLLAISCGLTALVRPTEILALMIPLLWGVYNKQSLKEKIQLILSKKKQIICFSLILISIGFIQFSYWKIYSGRFIFNSYYNPGEGLDLFLPHTIYSLFSFRNGWLIYTPVMIFALIGFYFLYKRNRKIFAPVFVYFFFALWVVTSWTVWWYGQCFGQRGLIPVYVILSVPMGYLLEELLSLKSIIKYLVLGIIASFIVLNLFQTWQVANGVLQSYRATSAYWVAVFGKTNILPEDQKLLYKEWPTNGIEIFTDSANYNKTKTWQLGFESNEGHSKEKLSSEIFHSGTSSFKLDSGIVFSPSIEKKYSDISKKYYVWIKVSVWVYPTFDVTKDHLGVVATFVHNGKAYKYKCIETNKLSIESGKWNLITFDYLSPEAVRNGNDLLSVYVINNSKAELFVDDLKVEVFEPKSSSSVFY